MKKKMPNHIAIIMDGNGRWAKKCLMPKYFGHKAGAEALNKLLEEIQKTEIKHVTLYAFSTENWKRSSEEIDGLIKLLKENIKSYIKENINNNFKMDTIGDISVFDDELKGYLNELNKISQAKSGLNVHIALNYGGRDEIIRAVKNIATRVKNYEINIDDIDEQMLSENLDTKKNDDPELIIRTSGEIRLSNFLIWQSAYSEFYFCDKLWPDFTFEDLKNALKVYQDRERRFGGRVDE